MPRARHGKCGHRVKGHSIIHPTRKKASPNIGEAFLRARGRPKATIVLREQRPSALSVRGPVHGSKALPRLPIIDPGEPAASSLSSSKL